MKLDHALVNAMRAVLNDDRLSPAFREQALVLPAEAYLAERMGVADPAAIHQARQFMRAGLAHALQADWLDAYESTRRPAPTAPTRMHLRAARCATWRWATLLKAAAPPCSSLPASSTGRLTT